MTRYAAAHALPRPASNDPALSTSPARARILRQRRTLAMDRPERPARSRASSARVTGSGYPPLPSRPSRHSSTSFLG